MDEKTFEQRLKETVAWCTRNPKLSKSAEYLRTPALRPSIDDDASLFMVGNNQATIAIEAMSQKRKRLLTDEAFIVDGDKGLAGGRLLVYFLGASNHNGTTVSISDYFDDEDNPPWDTWICCIAGKELTRPDEPFDVRIVISQRANTTDYVLSWVPPEWIEEVANAMRCEVTGAIMWADILLSRPEKYAIFDFHRCYIPTWLERYTIQ